MQGVRHGFKTGGGQSVKIYCKSIVNLKNSIIFSKNWGAKAPWPLGSGPHGSVDKICDFTEIRDPGSIVSKSAQRGDYIFATENTVPSKLFWYSVMK